MNNRLRTRGLQEAASLIVMLLLIIFVMSQLTDVFFTARNLRNMMLEVSTVGIIAVFTTMLMISGGLDLSVAANLALAGVIIGRFQADWGILQAALAAVGISTLIGALNGFLVTYVGINPLITTIGMLSAARGIALVVADGLTLPVFDLTGEATDAYTLFHQLGEGEIAGVPLPIVIMIALLIIGMLVMQFTTYGRALYAIGGNADASRLAGLSVRRYRMIAYTLTGFSAGIAAVLLTARLYAADPKAAPSIELTVITAVVLGGVSLAGGKGTLFGTVLGVLILTTLLNGLRLQSTSTELQNIAQGLVLLLAVGLDQLRTRNINWLKWLRTTRALPAGQPASHGGD